MRTPDGKECPYYYANFHRRTIAVEKCNLIAGGPFEQNWHSDLCKNCAVPQIKKANNCPIMQLHLRIVHRGLRFWEKDRIVIKATCSQHEGYIENPMLGCGKCHAPLSFVVGTDTEDG